MRHCPKCKASYPAESVICPKDQTQLVAELPFQTIDADGVTWVEIASTSTEDESRLLEGFLEAQDIPCHIESLKFNMEPVNLGSMGEIRVYVRADDEAAAMALLAAREAEYDTMDDDEMLLTDEGPADIGEGVLSESEKES